MPGNPIKLLLLLKLHLLVKGKEINKNTGQVYNQYYRLSSLKDSRLQLRESGYLNQKGSIYNDTLPKETKKEKLSL